MQGECAMLMNMGWRERPSFANLCGNLQKSVDSPSEAIYVLHQKPVAVYPQWLMCLEHSDLLNAQKIAQKPSQKYSMTLFALKRPNPLGFEKAFSMGLRSGLYQPKNQMGRIRRILPNGPNSQRSHGGKVDDHFP